MKKLSKIEIIVYDAGAVIMLLSLLLYPSTLRSIVPYIYFVGAIAFFVMQYRAQTDKSSVTIRSLERIQLIGAVLLVISVFPMWMDINMVWPLRHHEWIVFLSIGAWLQLYTAFRLPREIKNTHIDE